MKKSAAIISAILALTAINTTGLCADEYSMYFGRTSYYDTALQSEVIYNGEGTPEEKNVIFVTAFYDSDNNLIKTVTEKKTDSDFFTSNTILTEQGQYAYARCFLWSQDSQLEPICKSEKLALYPLNISYRSEVSCEPVTLTAVSGDNKIVEKKLAKYTYGTGAPMPPSYYFKCCSDSIQVFSDSIEIKKRGSYVLYVKYENGFEDYRDFYIDSIQAPEISLSYETADNKATVTVNVTNQNKNAPITKIVYKKGYPVTGGSQLDVLDKNGTAIEGNTFEVTESGVYTVGVFDEWGNGDWEQVRIQINQTGDE